VKNNDTLKAVLDVLLISAITLAIIMSMRACTAPYVTEIHSAPEVNLDDVYPPMGNE